MKKLFNIIFCFLLFSSCKEHQDNGITYNQSYVIGKMPKQKDFFALTDMEKRLDSLYSGYDESGDSRKNEFTKNRGRIFLTAYTNGKQSKIDSIFYKGMPAPCECLVDKDTVLINMGVGFFGGMGFNVQIAENSFLSEYFLYIDDVKPYKANLKDSFTNSLSIKSKFQYLILNSKPTFKAGQQLAGYLAITSGNYYEGGFENKLDTNYIKGKVFFTCTTKKKLY